jgi:hypothetical protein
MSRDRTRWLIRLGLIAVLGLAMLLWANRGRAPEGLAIENRSGQVIARLKVTAAGQVHTFDAVAMASEVSVPLAPGREDLVALEGQLADGSLVRWRGQAADGVRLIILPGGDIVVRQAAKS